jgi:hypothetical protein
MLFKDSKIVHQCYKMLFQDAKMVYPCQKTVDSFVDKGDTEGASFTTIPFPKFLEAAAIVQLFMLKYKTISIFTV